MRPFGPQVILVWSLWTFTPPSYGTVQYPDWALALGWCIVALILVWIPVVAVYRLVGAEGTPWKVWALRPPPQTQPTSFSLFKKKMKIEPRTVT